MSGYPGMSDNPGDGQHFHGSAKRVDSFSNDAHPSQYPVDPQPVPPRSVKPRKLLDVFTPILNPTTRPPPNAHPALLRRPEMVGVDCGASFNCQTSSHDIHTRLQNDEAPPPSALRMWNSPSLDHGIQPLGPMVRPMLPPLSPSPSTATHATHGSYRHPGMLTKSPTSYEDMYVSLRDDGAATSWMSPISNLHDDRQSINTMGGPNLSPSLPQNVAIAESSRFSQAEHARLSNDELPSYIMTRPQQVLHRDYDDQSRTMSIEKNDPHSSPQNAWPYTSALWTQSASSMEYNNQSTNRMVRISVEAPQMQQKPSMHKDDQVSRSPRLETKLSPRPPRNKAYVEIPVNPGNDRALATNTAHLNEDQIGANLVDSLTKLIEQHPDCQSKGFLKVSVTPNASREVFTDELEGSTIDRTQGTLEQFLSTSFVIETLSKELSKHSKLVRDNVVSAKGHRIPCNTFTFPHIPVGPPPTRSLSLSTHFSLGIKSSLPKSYPSYLIAPASTPAERSRLGLSPSHPLQCGTRLSSTRHHMPGIHTSWGYVSHSSGSFASLHIEDAGLGSINLLHLGAPKSWLIVSPAHGPLLESNIARIFPDFRKDNTCSQWVRHANLIILPDLLEEWGVYFTIVRCLPGEMVVTLPAAYHQVWNEGANVAEALNFAGEQWEAPAEYKYSSEGSKKKGKTAKCECTIRKEDLEWRDGMVVEDGAGAGADEMEE